MKSKEIFFLALFFFVFAVSGCDTLFANSSPPSEDEQADNPFWLTPLVSTNTPNPDEINIQAEPDFDIVSADSLIATPTVPFFEIITAKMHECDGLDYVVAEVKNTGPYYFQWIHFYLTNGYPSAKKLKWEDPWSSLGDSQCPVPTSGEDSLAPGAAADIYYQITTDYTEQYTLDITMCTFWSYDADPDPCHTEKYHLMVSLWANEPVLKIKELVLCWVGPGPLYEVVNSIPEGSSVELLGIGDVKGYLVVQEPKYQRPCWLRIESAEDVPEKVFIGLTNYETPILSAGVVNGQVFRDQDGNGAFDGADVGFPGALVSLAHGSCSNPGQVVTTSTNNEGWYTFFDVEPGNYCVFAAKPKICQGFSTVDSYDISIKWETIVEKNFGLDSCR